jgi:hypothetical protein
MAGLAERAESEGRLMLRKEYRIAIGAQRSRRVSTRQAGVPAPQRVLVSIFQRD